MYPHEFCVGQHNKIDNAWYSNTVHCGAEEKSYAVSLHDVVVPGIDLLGSALRPGVFGCHIVIYPMYCYVW